MLKNGRGRNRLRPFLFQLQGLASERREELFWNRSVPRGYRLTRTGVPLYELSLMDCREFRNKHVAFVDDLLPAVDMEAMQRHLAVCSRCSRHNTAIRRSLLLVHNLPPIEPSPEFMTRLNARLEQMSPMSRVDLVAPRPYLSSVGAIAALAAGIFAVAYMAVETTRYYAPTLDANIAPMTANASELVPASVGSGAFVASVPTGIPVWPAVLMVGEAPIRFATMDFHENGAGR